MNCGEIYNVLRKGTKTRIYFTEEGQRSPKTLRIAHVKVCQLLEPSVYYTYEELKSLQIRQNNGSSRQIFRINCSENLMTSNKSRFICYIIFFRK